MAGCLGNTKTIEVSTTPIKKPELVLPVADEVHLRQVKWIVLTEDNIDAKLEELTSSNQPIVLFALTSDGYENLGLNTSDIRALVQQQQKIIAAYASYYAKGY